MGGPSRPGAKPDRHGGRRGADKNAPHASRVGACRRHCDQTRYAERRPTTAADRLHLPQRVRQRRVLHVFGCHVRVQRRVHKSDRAHVPNRHTRDRPPRRRACRDPSQNRVQHGQYRQRLAIQDAVPSTRRAGALWRVQRRRRRV